ncbi:MAG TPA: hypothetical protein VFZ84_22465 [Burkholderiales bacterium]
MSSLETDRDRRHTAASVLQRIDRETVARLHEYADGGADGIAQRLTELDREWDTDRAIELEASAMGLVGLALGAFVRPGFLATPAAIGAAVFLHAMAGWYPLLPVFRRLGLRTAREIARERYALKALRGDFTGMESTRGMKSTQP